MFQFTHPHGVRLEKSSTSSTGQLFQFTHPHGVRRIRGLTVGNSERRFNSRTHTGCDFLHLVFFKIRGVSIHAPTRGATLRRKGYQHTIHVSIHAPTRGATNIFEKILNIPEFQFTHPHGVRLLATGDKTKRDIMFQFTHPHGVRLDTLRVYLPYISFQFTHPHGVRLESVQKILNVTVVSIHAPTRGATA